MGQLHVFDTSEHSGSQFFLERTEEALLGSGTAIDGSHLRQGTFVIPGIELVFDELIHVVIGFLDIGLGGSYLVLSAFDVAGQILACVQDGADLSS